MKKIDNNECLKEFGSYIKEARNWRNVTQTEVAQQLGISQTYYSYIENGQREVDLVLAVRICQELRLDMRDFITKFL